MKDTDVGTFLDLIWHRNLDTQIAEAKRQLNKKRFVGRKWYDQKGVNEARRKHQILLKLKGLAPNWDMTFDEDEGTKSGQASGTDGSKDGDGENKAAQTSNVQNG